MRRCGLVLGNLSCCWTSTSCDAVNCSWGLSHRPLHTTHNRPGRTRKNRLALHLFIPQILKKPTSCFAIADSLAMDTSRIRASPPGGRVRQRWPVPAKVPVSDFPGGFRSAVTLTRSSARPHVVTECRSLPTHPPNRPSRPPRTAKSLKSLRKARLSRRCRSP